MEIKKYFEIFLKSSTYLGFIKNKPNSILSFFMKTSEVPIQIGVFDEKSDKLYTFVIENNIVTFDREDEVFKTEESMMNPIDVDNIKIDIDKAEKIANEKRLIEYPKEQIIKEIIILQNIDEFGLIYNITFIAVSFNTLNFKISAITGEILNHASISLISIEKGEKGK